MWKVEDLGGSVGVGFATLGCAGCARISGDSSLALPHVTSRRASGRGDAARSTCWDAGRTAPSNDKRMPRQKGYKAGLEYFRYLRGTSKQSHTHTRTAPDRPCLSFLPSARVPQRHNLCSLVLTAAKPACTSLPSKIGSVGVCEP